MLWCKPRLTCKRFPEASSLKRVFSQSGSSPVVTSAALCRHLDLDVQSVKAAASLWSPVLISWLIWKPCLLHRGAAFLTRMSWAMGVMLCKEHLQRDNKKDNSGFRNCFDPSNWMNLTFCDFDVQDEFHWECLFLKVTNWFWLSEADVFELIFKTNPPPPKKNLKPDVCIRQDLLTMFSNWDREKYFHHSCYWLFWYL